MIDEFFLCDKEGRLPWAIPGAKNLVELVRKSSYIFKYNGAYFKHRFSYLPDNPARKKFTNNYPRGILRRVTELPKLTMGISEGVIDNRFEELCDLGIISSDLALTLSQREKAIIYCITNMMMAVEWKDTSNFPKNCLQLDGAYFKYIRRAHLIAKFSYNNKIAIVTHGNLPDYLTVPYASSLDTSATMSLDDILNRNKLEKRKFLREYNDYWNGLLSDTFLRYSDNINNTIMGHNFRGGAASLSVEKIPYNIHIRGHSPQGLMPRVLLSKDKYEIMLDISVLGGRLKNGKSNGFIRKGAYTYLEITRDNKMYIRGFFPHPIITEGTPNYQIIHIEQSKYVNKNEKGYSYNFPLDVYISEAFDKKLQFSEP
jgi:hypothetical protein